MAYYPYYNGNGHNASSFYPPIGAAAPPPIIPPPQPQLQPQTQANDYERMASYYERDNTTLRQELKNVRDKASETLGELARARDDVRFANARIEELQQEVVRTREAVGTREALKLAEMQAELGLRRQELRDRDAHAAMHADQLRVESERLRVCTEHLEQCRRENDDLRAKMQMTHDRSEAIQVQNGRKDELTKLLETNIGQMQQRLEQSERLVLALQGQLADKDHGLQRWQSEAEARSRTAADMDAQLKKFDAMRADYDTRFERMRAAYTEICDAFGATELQKQTFTAVQKVREMMAADAKVRAEMAEAKQSGDLRQYELNTRNMALDQQKAEIARLQEQLRVRDGELNAVREELLGRTRDLRTLTLTHGTMERDDRTRADQLARMQALLEQKDAQLLERDKHARDNASREQSQLYEARGDALRTQTEHSRVVASLQQRIGELEQAQRVDAEYVEVVRRVGRTLCVDPTTAPTQHASNVLQAVERLVLDRNEATKSANAATAAAAATYHQHQHGHPHLSASLQGLSLTNAMNIPGRNEEEWLRTQLLESEQRFVKAQVKYDGLIRDIARELHLVSHTSTHPDVDTLLDEIARLHKTKTATATAVRAPAPPATPPTRPRPTTARISSDKPLDAARSTDLQRQLQSAIQTMESQDKYIAHLNAKLAVGGDPALVQTLRDETAALKAQLAVRFPGNGVVGGVGVGNGVGVGIGNGVGVGVGVGSTTATIAELEQRLQAHIDFRLALMRALQMPGPSATNEAILRRVEQLMADALRPTPGLLAGSSTGASTGYKSAAFSGALYTGVHA